MSARYCLLLSISFLLSSGLPFFSPRVSSAEFDDPPVGVIARYDDHGTGIPLDAALRMGVKVIQLKAPFPDKRTDADVRTILDKVARAGVRITSVQSGFTGESYKTIAAVRETVGLVPEGTRAERIEQFHGVCDFTRKLGLDTVCFHLGVVPEDTSSAAYREIVKMLRDLCDYARTCGLQINLETGQETARALLRFIEDVGRPNLFVNFDPANMILYGREEPIEALELVGRYVRSVHCKDAVWSSNRGVEWGREVPFGEGALNARLFLTTLRKTGFRGPLIVERENRESPEAQRREAYNAVVLIEKIKGEIHWGEKKEEKAK